AFACRVTEAGHFTMSNHLRPLTATGSVSCRPPPLTASETGRPAHGAGSNEHREHERTGLWDGEAGDDVVIQHAIGCVPSLDNLHSVERNRVGHSQKKDIVESPVGTKWRYQHLIDGLIARRVDQAKRGRVVINRSVAPLNYENAKSSNVLIKC